MERILIVDDSVTQAAKLKSILKDDYEVTIAATAKDGLSCASLGGYSLILLDVVMPEMDGFMLLKKLQEEIITQSVPVILITSLSDIENEQQGFLLGAVDYITKPFHPLIVKARVNTHVKLYQYRRQVEEQSMTDQLTGIANRRQYDLYSEKKWKEAAYLRVPFSVFMFDIDNFKAYNDIFGHPAGDKVIAAVAGTIAKNLRRTMDFVARYGGEEFAAIMIGGNPQIIFEHMKKIRKSIEELKIPHAPYIAKRVTVSVGGVTVIPNVNDSYDTYLKIADAMLYDAKHFGKNQVVWYGDDKKQWREIERSS